MDINAHGERLSEPVEQKIFQFFVAMNIPLPSVKVNNKISITISFLITFISH